MFRFTIAASLLLVLSLDASASGWQRLKLGNGGIVTRLDIAHDGTMVNSTDSFGCYIWSVTQNQWVQLLNVSAMPIGTGPSGDGCDEIRIDPANTSNIWMLWNGNLYKSTNKGASFSAVSSYPTQPANSTDGSPTKSFGPYGAIDPNNSNVLYFSTTSRGLYFTNDGTTFSQVTASSAGLPGSVGNNPARPASAGTDATSVTVGTGRKTFTTNSASFGFSVGTSNFVQVWETSNPAIQMIGNVTASSAATFTINVTNAQGSGTHSDWTVGNLNAIGGGHRIVFDTSGGTISLGGQVRTANVFVHTYLWCGNMEKH